ncbi:MAG TPA: alpha/beta hydrolase [Chloroflexi bacterium]|nr:alpha/beta hydrolase [Chloroflexota bacterium]
MKHHEGNFSNNKGQSIYYQSWLPEGKVKASAIIAHGLNEHSGRYQHLAAFLTDKGYAVYGLDFPGHGKSAGPRSYVDSYYDFIDPLETYLEMIHSWQPDLPVFLLGHSMGGLISAAFLIDHQDRVSGAVLSGPLVKLPDYVSNFTLQLGKTLAALLPKFRIIQVDADGVSRDPAVVQAYKDDPLVYTGKITARISNEINNAIALVEQGGSKIKIPLLLLHGGADRLCDPSWSRYLHDLVSSPDKQLIIYDGLYHEVYNEPEADTVFADLLKWLEKHIA